MEDNSNEKAIRLADGRSVTIAKGKGKHAQEAMKASDGDSSKYMTALMAQLVTIDGKKVVMEDLEELDLQDFMKIQTEFANINF